MSPDPPRPLVRPFPKPSMRIENAYRELEIAANGTDEQRRALGTLGDLPRPWSPATCSTAVLRSDVWDWLEAVVTWLNHELVFDPADTVPACWPRHAHLVHEVAVLADLRRRADRALTSDLLEDWHRYSLPGFLERMRHRVSGHCDERHPPTWPSAGRFARHLDTANRDARRTAFATDIDSVRHRADQEPLPTGVRLVDTRTGELLD